MRKKSFKAQNLVEIGIIVAIGIGVTLPVILPLVKDTSKLIADSSPNKNVVTVPSAPESFNGTTPSSSFIDPTPFTPTPVPPGHSSNPTNPTGSSDPADPSGSSDPADPSNPVDPTDPSNPTSSTDPTESNDPADPTDPASDHTRVIVFSSYVQVIHSLGNLFSDFTGDAIMSNPVFKLFFDKLQGDPSSDTYKNLRDDIHDFIKKLGSPPPYNESGDSRVNPGLTLVIRESDYKLIGMYVTTYVEDTSGVKFGEEERIQGTGKVKDQVVDFPHGQSLYVVDSAFASPLIFDLDGNGITTLDKIVSYDIYGNGKKVNINDVNDGVLCIRGGTTGRDLFGDNTDLNNDGKPDGFSNGFEALKELAKKEKLIDFKKDMKLDAKDILVLEGKYSFGLKVGYEGVVKPLRSYGIDEINIPATFSVDVINHYDKYGNKLMTQEGAEFTMHGKKHFFADLWHKITKTVANFVDNIKKNF